jgi:hypothetical protein
MTYSNGVFRRKKFPRNHEQRSLKWHGPRFVRGRRSSRPTAVWTLRPRRLCNEVLA